MIRRNTDILLSEQMKNHVDAEIKKKSEYDGDIGLVVSTGSTLLDLAISGGRVRGGGLPGGIMVEISGPESSGKTVLLSEIAGNVQRAGGEIKFNDPEGRLNKQFAQMFGLKIDEKNYARPDTVPEIFNFIQDWQPKDNGVIHGIFTDSLAALSTHLEMDNKEGDKMGGRRAKEFSEGLRKTCRILSDKNYLMVCSNQLRQNIGVTFGPKYESPGGEAIKFYASLRLRTDITKKIRREKEINGKIVKRIIGVEIEVEVIKSSIWKPFHSAPVTIVFDYGVDQIKDNLQFIKDHTENTTYMIGSQKLSSSMDKAIQIVEQDGLEGQLREEVITLWEEIEQKFESERIPKRYV